ncbi:ABC transporter substrate-binding protein [Streptomyces sp. B1866]|uniref:ABC transporter substrate-binding protein n=1 Tax=Streptomyces sp. B1866 TaxID=3075431 RepID=UPI00288F1C6E|nr:ABC transporter substrate-binding protein [Streptomyces sp. B1866]MDT3399318.1 ABC transporter substrate-binding protein [Streptomyces sp. B1866]
MTGRRRIIPHPRRAMTATLCTAVGVSLLASCGSIPGTTAAAQENSITVMTWAPEDTSATNMPGMPAMARAFARWVNDTGGIHGRKLRVLTCNEHNDSVQAATCARRAAAEKAVAVVGSYSQHGSSFMAPLEIKGIPYIGGYGLSEEEFSSPYSYPVNGGQAALFAGNGRQLASICEQVALVRPDTIAGDELPDLLNAGLTAGGGRPATDVRAPEDASDYTAQAREALKGVGARTGAGTGTGADGVGASTPDPAATGADGSPAPTTGTDATPAASTGSPGTDTAGTSGSTAGDYGTTASPTAGTDPSTGPADTAATTGTSGAGTSGAESGGTGTSAGTTGTGGGATSATSAEVASSTGAARRGGKSGSCVTAVLGMRTSTFFDSFRRVHEKEPKVRIASVLGSVRQALVDSTGGADSALEGAYATGWYPAADDPRWRPMNEVISKYAFNDNAIDPADPGTQTTWIAYTALRSVLLSLKPGDISATTVRRALDNGYSVNTGGLTPTLRWADGDMLAVSSYSRITNADVTYQEVRDGRLVATRQGFVDVTDTLQRLSGDN